jgi:hypothetical protein
MEVIFKTVTLFYIASEELYIVLEKKGCGFDEQEVILVDYPKFLHQIMMDIKTIGISGIENSNAVTTIFDRYGKF